MRDAIKSQIKPIGEMTEINLLKTVEIFWPDGDWGSQKRFYYDPANKRRFYKVDCYSENMKMIWEYDGPDHYEDVWKIKRDNERKEFFEAEGYRFLRWPYYLQLTADVARHFFGRSYSKQKYCQALRVVYGVNNENLVLSPGLHEYKRTPANFVKRGVDRFFNELKTLPDSVSAQLAEGLRRYILDVEDRYLVVGEDPRFERLLQRRTAGHHLKVYYHRKIPSELIE